MCWLESGASAVLGKLTELVTAPACHMHIYTRSVLEQPRSGRVRLRRPGCWAAGLWRHQAAAAPLPTSCVTLLQKARKLRSRHRLAVVGRLGGGIAERGHAHEAGVVLHGGIGVVADVFATERPGVVSVPG